MSKKPILFNTEMVKAILDGRKTQTRRVVNKEYLGLADIDGNNIYIEDEDGNHFNILETTWAKYKVDDILYVRETFGSQQRTRYGGVGEFLVYKADYSNTLYHEGRHTTKKSDEVKWKPSIFMPKKYARIFLKVTNVRVERLQDIILDDIEKEGFNKSTGFFLHDLDNALDWWINLWNSTAKDGYKWEDNPYVFVYEFERVENE